MKRRRRSRKWRPVLAVLRVIVLAVGIVFATTAILIFADRMPERGGGNAALQQ